MQIISDDDRRESCTVTKLLCRVVNWHLNSHKRERVKAINEVTLPGGLLGTDESEATAFTDNRNFGRWLFPFGVDDANDLTLLDSGDGVILHETSSAQLDA